MPKSKRSRPAALTQTEKRSTRDYKTRYIQQVRDLVDEYDSVYLFRFDNMRSHHFKDVRQYFAKSSSRLLLGKNKLLQIALGRNEEEEYTENLHHVAKQIESSVGLLFTSEPRDDIVAYFNKLQTPDFARAGFVAPREVTILLQQLEDLPVSIMESLRKLGVPCKIDNGKIVFHDKREMWRLCCAGEELSAEKCKLLHQFSVPLAVFRLELVCRWEDEAVEMLV